MRHPCRRSALARLTAWLRRTDRCATSLEFASLAIPCFMMLLGVMEISYDLYVQAELDNLADTAARSVQVGAATGISNETSSTFTAASICPSVGGLLDCTLITVAVAPIPTGSNYFSAPVQQQITQTEANNGTGICTGTAAQMMVLRLWYDGPSFVGLLLPSFTKIWNGKIVHETTSSAGFVNEYFTNTGQAGGAACAL
jgi:Flp pilus assembly protein TadG